MNEAGSNQTNPTLLCLLHLWHNRLSAGGEAVFTELEIFCFSTECSVVVFFLFCVALYFVNMSMRAFSGDNIFPIKLQTCTSCFPLAFLKQSHPKYWVLRVRKLHEVTVIWIPIVSYQRKQTWHFIYVKMSLYAPPTEQHTDLCPELSRSAAEGARTLALLSFDTVSCVLCSVGEGDRGWATSIHTDVAQFYCLYLAKVVKLYDVVTAVWQVMLVGNYHMA